MSSISPVRDSLHISPRFLGETDKRGPPYYATLSFRQLSFTNLKQKESCSHHHSSCTIYQSQYFPYPVVSVCLQMAPYVSRRTPVITDAQGWWPKSRMVFIGRKKASGHAQPKFDDWWIWFVEEERFKIVRRRPGSWSCLKCLVRRLRAVIAAQALRGWSSNGD